MADNRKLAQGLMMMTPSARADLAQREGDIQRGKTVELLRRAGQEMYDNPIVNTAIGFTPVLGDVQAAGETMAALNRGAPWQETAGYAAGMLPFVPMIGKTVWHGSPHTFDKFDLSKIGTGEGAQAYGHGLYLAESPEIAGWYQKQLGKYYDEMMTPEGIMPLDEAIKKYHPEGESASKVAGMFRKKLDVDSFNKAVEDVYLPEMRSSFPENEWSNFKPQAGNLYKVDLPDEQIAKMLDWDKPLSEQPQAVQDALHQAALVNFETNIGPKASGEIGDLGWTKNVKSMSGEDLYRKLTEGAFTNEMFLQGTKKGEAQAVISDKLRQAGIPGIQYLDQASRGAGEGTRNYVVFSDEIPQILERNGQPVAQALRNYGLEHRPMTIEGGASQLHELTPSFGEDVYGKQAMQFFGSGDPREKKALEIMKSVRGNPDAPVTIYRGVPEGVNQINQGDWVTIVPEVAADYGNVISQQVPASHITSWPDSLMEFGYYPSKAK